MNQWNSVVEYVVPNNKVLISIRPTYFEKPTNFWYMDTLGDQNNSQGQNGYIKLSSLVVVLLLFRPLKKVLKMALDF